MRLHACVHLCVCVCVCVCDAQSFQQSQSVRYHTAPLYSNVCTAAMFGLPLPVARVCVCVPRESIQSCSNGEVQQSYAPTTSANHKFIVLSCRVAAQEGRISSYVQSPPTHYGSCPKNPPRDIKTHIACWCALPLPTSPSHASLGRQGGRGAVGHPQTRRTVEGGHGCTVMSPPASQPAANHPTMEGKEKLGKGGGGPLTAESPG